MKNLAIVFLSISAVAAYRDRQTASSIRPFDEFPPYQRTYEHPPFENRYQSFREQPFKSQHYHSYRSRPFREESSYRDRGLYKDQSLVPEYSSYKDQSYYTQQPFKSYRGEGTFGKASSFFENQPSFKDNLSYKGHSFADTASLKNIYRDQTPARYEDSFPQLPEKDQTQYQQERDAFQENHSEAYVKQPSSEKEQLDVQASNYYRLSDYLKYGNHGLGFATVPEISSYENPLPLNDETSTATEAPTAPTATHKPLLQSTDSVSSTPLASTKIHTSSTAEPKIASTRSSTAVTTQTVKSDTLAEMLPTVPTRTSSTKAVIPTTAATKEPAKLAHSSMPPAKNMPTETPVVSFEGQTLPTIRFQLANFTADTPPTFYLSGDSKSKEPLFKYVLPESGMKDAFKASIQAQILKYMLPDLSSNSVDSLVQRPVLNYLLPTEPKNTFKDSLRDSLLNYFLQQGTKDRLTFPQSSISETMNYVPLTTVNERPIYSLPSIPLATLSTVPRPEQTVNYVSAGIPKMPFMSAPPPASNNFQLANGILPSTLSTTLQNGLPTTTSISSGLSTGLPGTVPNGVPSSLSPNIPSGMPTLSLSQAFPQLRQLRPFEPVRNQPYAQGLPLQLGGFAGIDYSALRPSNPAPQPMGLGISKVGLSLPELARPQVPTFTKLEFGQQIW